MQWFNVPFNVIPHNIATPRTEYSGDFVCQVGEQKHAAAGTSIFNFHAYMKCEVKT